MKLRAGVQGQNPTPNSTLWQLSKITTQMIQSAKHRASRALQDLARCFGSAISCQRPLFFLHRLQAAFTFKTCFLRAHRFASPSCSGQMFDIGSFRPYLSLRVLILGLLQGATKEKRPASNKKESDAFSGLAMCSGEPTKPKGKVGEQLGSSRAAKVNTTGSRPQFMQVKLSHRIRPPPHRIHLPPPLWHPDTAGTQRPGRSC